MSVSIEYSVIDDTSDVLLDDMNADIDEVCDGRDWYIEPLHLFDSNGNIVGFSKLFRLSDEFGNELDPAEEAPKVLNDIQFLVSALTKLSKKRNVSWELAIEGAPIGNVSESGPDGSLVQTLEEMVAIFTNGFGFEPAPEPVAQKEAATVRNSTNFESEVPNQNKRTSDKNKKPWWKFW